jgi:hypothetical protein
MSPTPWNRPKTVSGAPMHSCVPGVGANGEGDAPEAAIADLREAVEGLIAEFGAPQELTLTVDVA